MSIKPSPNELYQSALAYAQRGWHVFPCKRRDKVPLTEHGFKDATTAPETIRKWWERWPNANIGIATGASDLVVIDVDNKRGHRGTETWLDVLDQVGHNLAQTVRSETPNKGTHLYYRANGHKKKSVSGALGDGVDLKAIGGYVIGPPSVVTVDERDGLGEYAWDLGGSPDVLDIMPLPNALATLLPDHVSPSRETAPAARERPRAEDITTAERCLKRLSPARCDQYDSWVQIGMALSGLGNAGLALWDAWSQRSAKHKPGECAAKWRSFAPDHGLTLGSLVHWAEEDRSAAAAKGNGLPRIDVAAGQLRELSDAAWGHLVAANDPPRLFRHGGSPVRFQCDGGPLLVALDPYCLRHETARASHWIRVSYGADGSLKNHHVHPPLAVMRDMLKYPQFPLPAVDRIVRAPAYAPDGTLQATPGYHAAGRIIVCLEAGLEIPDVPIEPSSDDVRAAVATVDDLLFDFPMSVPADRAHAFALFLLPFVRDMIHGSTPMYLIESPAPGTGKGLLESALLIAAVGDDMGTLSAGRDEEEWRKRLTTVLRSGHPVVAIDNVDKTLASSHLAHALTARLWRDRLMGTMETVSLPVRCVWVATGNNPMLSTEIARRCVRIRLDARLDQPWRRDPAQFRYQKLLTHARSQRGALIAAALTLGNAWLAAGRPEAKTPPLGSYEEWASVLGGILSVAGIEGFLTNLDELYERADSEGAAWRRFVGAWWDKFGEVRVGVKDLYPLAEAMEDFPLGRGQERAQKTVLGKGLRKHLDMVIGRFRIESVGTSQKTARYCLRATRLENGVPGVPGVPSQSGQNNIDGTQVGWERTRSTRGTPNAVTEGSYAQDNMLDIADDAGDDGEHIPF